MITYIDSNFSILQLICLVEEFPPLSELITYNFNSEEEFKEFFNINNIKCFVSNARTYNTRIPDYQILDDYEALKIRFGL